MALRLRVRALVVLCLLLATTSLLAANGRITGRITRTDGSGIGGVIVQIVELQRVELTDANGEFRLQAPPGTYTVTFTAGNDVATENNVTVTDGGTTRLDKQVDWRISVAETITVYSASRRTERVVEAPAAVTVATTEQIAAVAPSGQAPRIIESAPGVDFTQSGLYDFNYNTRGFNSSLNRRVLTLIDGRDPSVPFLGAQEWAALSFPIDEMSSVELVRGPGSALYGANAFSGVLNMTTKDPRTFPGGRLMLTGGDLNTRRADIRQGGALGDNGWHYRVVGGFGKSDDWTRARNVSVEYSVPCAASGAINCIPKEPAPLATDRVNVAFGGLRFDKYFTDDNVLTMEGGYATLEGPTFQTGIGRVQVTDVEHPWARVNYSRPHWNALAYYDARIADRQIALSSGSGVIPGTTGLWEDSYNIHGELQTNWAFMQDRTRVTLGGAYNTQHVDTSAPNGFHTLMAQAESEQQQSAFGQVEFNLLENLKLVGAARWDNSNLHEAQFSPKGALVWEFRPSHTLRYGYNEAFQRPNYSELFLRAPAGAPVNLAGAALLNPASAPLAPLLTQLGFGALPLLARGNENLDVEKVRSHELGYAGIFGGKVFMTVDVYQSRLSDFVTDLLPGANPAFQPYTVPSSVPAPFVGPLNNFLAAALQSRLGGLTTVNGQPALVFSYTNAGEVDTRGAEFAINYYINNSFVWDFNYTWFDFDVKEQRVGDQLLPNSPEHKFNTGLSWRGTRFDARVGYRWVDEFAWAAGIFVGEVRKYHVLNAGANFRFNDMIGFGVDVSNLTDHEHYEAFGGDLLGRRALGVLTVNW